jgi:hypothetical protein
MHRDATEINRGWSRRETVKDRKCPYIYSRNPRPTRALACSANRHDIRIISAPCASSCGADHDRELLDRSPDDMDMPRVARPGAFRPGHARPESHWVSWQADITQATAAWCVARPSRPRRITTDPEEPTESSGTHTDRRPGEAGCFRVSRYKIALRIPSKNRRNA